MAIGLIPPGHLQTRVFLHSPHLHPLFPYDLLICPENGGSRFLQNVAYQATVVSLFRINCNQKKPLETLEDIFNVKCLSDSKKLCSYSMRHLPLVPS